MCAVSTGIAGISTAYKLVSSSKDVVMVEGREVLLGESGRTSVYLGNALDKHYINIIKKHRREGTQTAADSHT